MAIREITASGIEAVNITTELLQRSRQANPRVGIFEAADVQWAWRTPRISDESEKTFWLDESGPVAGILLTSFSEDRWQIDPVVVPDTKIDPMMVWERTLEHISRNPDLDFDLPVSDDDAHFTQLAHDAGLVATDQDDTGWLDADRAPAPRELPDGLTLVDRTKQVLSIHPMNDRNGHLVADRLRQCSLYDPSLDISVETNEGIVAGYSLYWFDPVTKVGLIEPVRVHDDFQRKGIARTMLTHGIDRLVTKGAERIKVSWESEAAGALYLGVGFGETSTTTWFSTPVSK